jgi:hypothetical protein
MPLELTLRFERGGLGIKSILITADSELGEVDLERAVKPILEALGVDPEEQTEWDEIGGNDHYC